MSSDPGEVGVTGVAEGSESDALKIGEFRKDEVHDVVRAINFSGGAFDTTMQLGVIHALVVIQGRPPDVVVGLSAGSLNAVALAEVLQAGDHLETAPWEHLTPEERAVLQARRLEARTARFQEILDRLFAAPQDLIDGLLPDAYQVDAQDPLKSVEAPVFLEEERDRRDAAVANRNGLARLYNRVLGLRLSFGTLTRAVRRGLGIKAASEIREWYTRLLVRGVEVSRLWILMGANLIPLSRLLPFLLVPAWGWVSGKGKGLLKAALAVLDPDLPKRLDGRPGYTAGALIFRFPWIDRGFKALGHLIAFLVVFTVWVLASNGIVLFPWSVARLSSLSASTTYAVATAIVAFLTVVGWGRLQEFDRTTALRMFQDVAKSALFVLALISFWTTAWLGVLIAVRATLFGSPELDWMENVSVEVAGWRTKVESISFVGFFVGLVLLILLGIVIYRGGESPGAQKRWRRRYMRALLQGYRMRQSVFSPYPLERLFVDLFDPPFWGKAGMNGVVERSLQDRVQATRDRDDDTTSPEPKRLSSYWTDRPEPIRVGLAVSDLSDGRLDVVPQSASVVNGLLAASAMVPLFPPRNLCSRWFVDGANVTNEPMQALLRLLRRRIHPGVKVTHVYSVTPLPISSDQLGPSELLGAPGKDEPYLSLVEVTFRALRLQRFRDATVERRLTELYTQVLPVGQGVRDLSDGEARSRFLRVWVTPVEPEAPIELNRRLFRAKRDTARKLVLETIADGCRASLEAMIGPSMRSEDDVVSCATAVRRHLRQRRSESTRREGHDLLGSVVGLSLPGSEPARGPGLASICRHCALGRETDRSRSGKLDFRGHPRYRGLPWPHERESGDPEPSPTVEKTESQRGDPHYEGRPISSTKAAARAVAQLHRGPPPGWRPGEVPPEWPRASGGVPGRERALRTALFSGGVFRGVYQMGVIGAMSNLGLRPDLVAGASVGSITAAMVAGVFGAGDEGRRAADASAEALEKVERDARNKRVAELAAVYLAIDRLVLTDRFADFVRNLTVRAARADFSLRQADRVFRRFDAPGPGKFDADVRAVVAGIERLFYLSPFEVLRLVEAIRHRDGQAISTQLRAHAQEWLERMNVPDEVLGADILARLVTEYVTPVLGAGPHRYGNEPSFDDIRDRLGMHFLATTTNLTDGCLEILGISPRPPWGEGGPAFTKGLLASSAFPGVFRPRDAHEVYPTAAGIHQYVDGGLMDNLPLDALAEFLVGASEDEHHRVVTRQPKVGEGNNLEAVPHLVFSASLEVDLPWSDAPFDRMSWPELLARARQLGYNRKLAAYEKTQLDLRRIYRASTGENPRGTLEPLNLELVVVKPKWLCGTFSFHPMLGYRRRMQAQSIAHGCASTMVRFGSVKEDHATWVRAWELRESAIPGFRSLDDAFDKLRPSRKAPEEGKCWLNDKVSCPYAGKATAKLPTATRAELFTIYEECRRRRTHGPEVKA